MRRRLLRHSVAHSIPARTSIPRANVTRRSNHIVEGMDASPEWGTPLVPCDTLDFG